MEPKALNASEIELEETSIQLLKAEKFLPNGKSLFWQKWPNYQYRGSEYSLLDGHQLSLLGGTNFI